MESSYYHNLTVPSTLLCLVSAFALSLVTFAWLNAKKKDSLPLPPGPPPLPIVGNLLSLDREKPWLTCTEWGKQYGELMTVHIFGKVYIVINSTRVAKALVDGRSAMYSDRPPFGDTSKFYGMDFNTAHLRYNDRWRAHRKVYRQALRPEMITAYHPLQLRKARQLVGSLLDSPDKYPGHLSILAASLIMEIAYGYDPAPHNDRFVAGIERLLELTVANLTPAMTVILGAFPWLQSIPPWLPGAGFKKTALQCQELSVEVSSAPFEYVKERIKAGTAPKSVVSDLLVQMDEKDRLAQELILKECATSAYIAGVESTHSVLLVFMMMMIMHPEVQSRAQAEIEAVVGTDRLPEFSDRPFLPFVDAILRETQRWAAMVPLCVPHATTNDDIYEGYLIPKGAGIILNLWGMTRDSKLYPDPSEFRPERFITEDGTLSEPFTNLSFGFGRRICPGRFVADASIWIAMVTMLATLTIGKAVGKAGYEIEVVPEFGTGIILQPKPFVCRIERRSPATETLIKTSLRAPSNEE
ncbi:cytochrome P450 [Leucogyrophana mollusca]|uniref:Cytochrome P450 n=1 Tax=Leucogyrophana mollusca TaxID=85980 RepID=A0ACB8BE13_9AGAM|nr:cytochrome P450 [Leucogyrophana mollusca]